MSYKTQLQGNNTDLQAILDTVNALPEAGSSDCVEVTLRPGGNMAFYYVDENGVQQELTPTTDTTVKAYKGVIGSKVGAIMETTGDYVSMGGVTGLQAYVYIFRTDGGTIKHD